MRILITGIANALGRRMAERLVLEGEEVLGLDRRPWPDAPPGVTMFNVDVRKRPAEEAFRLQPDAVIHMATVTHLAARKEERYRINLHGTQAVLERCKAYGVKQVIFISRHTVYGAAIDAPLYRTEPEPPLAGSTFPNLADLVSADLFAGSAIWRCPAFKTCVLRLVYTLGPSMRGTLSQLLSTGRVPTIIGFDPLFHFMHEHDAADAILAALRAELRGVYNIAGPPPVPLSILAKGTGRKIAYIPEIMFPKVTGKLGLPALSPYAIKHLKYPVVIDNALFREATGFKHAYDEVTVMDAYRAL
ncbi:NAD-dependent epimerase/dehydratase family protein [Myxococcota bacterium]|nr:NAD-dependent epimerase/dehydratase family protein [Myxococcota bacterium]MBU1429995.1 NAD-dependent epimerase/dehydratase family protein [Myxococcota bacterium]MBU1898844.1 NAD-dependent epimerase/dehydratase family protein [Myxococcota bacterium]